MEGKAPNCGIQFDFDKDSRRGRHCKISPLSKTASARVQTLREQSFQIHGARLFNTLPKSIRNTSKCSDLEFKEKLDSFLSRIPDQPLVGDMLPHALNSVNARHSNSLLDQIPGLQRSTGAAED